MNRRSIMNRVLLGITILLTSCRASSDEPLDAPNSVDEAQPADVDAIARLLRARHVEDLPDAEALARYPSAEASLRHLAREGDTMVVRTRALSLLQHFSSEPTGALLAEVVSDGSMHPALRAAAIEGLAGQPLDRQPERLEVVLASLRDKDPRVGLAAVEVLEGFEAGRRALGEVSVEDLPPAVRTKLESR